jgi:S1-C subfamily serine protease
VVAPDGTLIGLALLGPRGRALAIPASTVARAVETLREKGYVPRGYLGVSLHPASEGVLVTAVEPQSPAGTAGLLMGDLITKWNDREIRSVPALFNALTGAAGTRAKLGLVRGGNPLDIEIDIGERPRQ